MDTTIWSHNTPKEALLEVITDMKGSAKIWKVSQGGDYITLEPRTHIGGLQLVFASAHVGGWVVEGETPLTTEDFDQIAARLKASRGWKAKKCNRQD